MRHGYDLPQRSLVSHSEHSIVERPDVPRSRFKQSWTRKQTMNAGLVVPFFWDEFLPGDYLRYDMTAYLRMATPLFPMFSNVKADIFVFAVPNRLVWAEWERFMGEQATPAESIDVTHPTVSLVATSADLNVGQLADYLGIPPDIPVGGTLNVNALPFRAYQLVWNEWFRDQNLQNSAVYSVASGPDTLTDRIIRPRAKFHDYFTTSLPWTQKFTNPTVPIAGTAPVTGIGVTGAGTTGTQAVTETLTLGAGNSQNYGRWFQNANVFVEGNPGTAIPWVFADLSAATGVSINQLRQAVQIQRLLERDARGGTRYAEIVLAHFGVRTPDYRVQRPEYIGGGTGMIHVTPVAQTAPGATPVGALGGAATGVVQGRASYAATEHGVILGLVSLRPEQVYTQGVRRAFLRRTRYDYYWPSLAQLGEQTVTRAEIWAQGNSTNDDTAFGFQERFAEYRQRVSDAAALMRPGVTNSIAQWNLAQRFTAAPVLGDTFIRADNVAFDRVLAAGQTARDQNQQFLLDALINLDAVRPLPMFGTPVGMGRF